MADIELVVKIPEKIYDAIQADEMISREQLAVLQMHILKGTQIQKGHGDLIDRSKLDVTPIDITDLPIDRCLLVYMAEDVDNAPALVCADKGSEGKDEGSN